MSSSSRSCWCLRVSVNGVAKSVEVDGGGRVGDAVEAVRKAFKLGDASVTLQGGFPPRPLAEDALLSAATTDRALLRAVVAKKDVTTKKPAAAAPKKTTTTTTQKKKTKADDEAAVAEGQPKPKKRRVKGGGETLGTAEGLTAAVSSSKTKDSLFFRKALKGALAGAYETSRANDRLMATVSGAFEIAERSQRLDGGVSSFEVTFAETSAGAKTRRKHAETVEALNRETLVGVLKTALERNEGDMLVPGNVVRCSPRVFWNVVYHYPRVPYEDALRALLPFVRDWDAVFRGETVPLPPDDEPAQVEDPRQARLRAAERRFETRPPDEAPPREDVDAALPREDVDAALLGCVQGDRAAVSLLARGANVTAPRDLALWRDCADVLRGIIAETLPDDEETIIPPTADLERWAKAAADLLHTQAGLGEFLAAPSSS